MTAPAAATTVAYATQRGTIPAYTEPPGVAHRPPGACTCPVAACPGCDNTTFQVPACGTTRCAACGRELAVAP